MTPAARVYVARLAGLAVFDPHGDQVGRVRDVVAVFRPGRPAPQVVGLVVEVPGRRRVFVPMTRVVSVDAGQVITTGLVNLRRFEQRATETLLLAELLDRAVRLGERTAGAGAGGVGDVGGVGDGAGGAGVGDGAGAGGAGETSEGPDGLVTIEDLAIEEVRDREWRVCRAFVRRQRPGRLRRRGEAMVVDIGQLTCVGVVEERQGAANLLAALEGLKAADLAEVVHELAPKRRLEVAAALDDERLADVLEELSEAIQVEILAELGEDRAADVLEVMQPDDAADLLSELPPEQAEQLLGLMDPDEAADVRRLLAYADDTAGGLMTSEPVILGPEATVAEALARVRRTELIPALASAVFVCRPPLETPTGRYLGLVHIQRLLRHPPHEPVGPLVDRQVEPLGPSTPLSLVTRRLATYNLVSLPVTDGSRLVGVVTVDDVLDHLLPAHWRDTTGPDGGPDTTTGRGQDVR